MLFCSESVLNNAHTKNKKCRKNGTFSMDYSRLYSNTLPFHRPVVTSHFILLRIAV